MQISPKYIKLLQQGRLKTTEMTSDQLSEYERKRLDKIRQNQQILHSLAIPNLSTSLIGTQTKKGSSLKNRKKKAEIQDLPRRISTRLQERAANPHSTKMSIADELALYRTINPSLAPSRERPPRILGNIPFAPERDQETLQKTLKSVLASTERTPTSSNPVSNPFHSKVGNYHIEGEFSVAKVMEDRVYSLAIHPNPDRILVTVGSRMGAFGVWDVTEAWKHQPDQLKSEEKAIERQTFYFKPHTGSITAQRYSSIDSSKLFMSSYDGIVRCLDFVRGEFLSIYHREDHASSQLITSMEVSSDGLLLYFTDYNGVFSRYDIRAPDSLDTFQVHEKKAGGLSISPVDPHCLATCSLDDTICIWDMRKLPSQHSSALPVHRLEYSRAVTAVNFHPRLRDVLVSTAYDDSVRIHQGIGLANGPSTAPSLSSSYNEGNQLTEQRINHNNQTGRWITPFKAIWDLKSNSPHNSRVIVGNMNRGLDIIHMAEQIQVVNNQSEFLTAQPAVNAVHPTLDLIVSGTASGRCFLWKPH